jgi:hypothetical protein
MCLKDPSWLNHELSPMHPCFQLPAIVYSVWTYWLWLWNLQLLWYGDSCRE